jgi:hypothetical protein
MSAEMETTLLRLTTSTNPASDTSALISNKTDNDTAPSPRGGMGMAYDAGREEVVLFGGADFDGTPLGDTWTRDGTTWLLQAGSGSCLQTPSGLVSWWSGDRTADDVQGTNPGELVGGASFKRGMVGPGFVFDGVNGGVKIPNSASLSQTRITLNAWVYPTGNQNTNRHIIDKDNFAVAREYILALNADNKFHAFVNLPSGEYNLAGTTAPGLNNWCHVAMTHDGLKLRLYVNGLLDGEVDAVGDMISTQNSVGIGNNVQGEVFKGIIDEAQIFNRALSDTEILAIYEAGAAGQCKPEIFVSSIVPSYRVSHSQYLVTTSVTIEDTNDISISDATANVKTLFPDGSTLIFPTQTDESGIATFSFYTTETGHYNFKVIRVSHPIRDYDPSINIETTDTLVIP